MVNNNEIMEKLDTLKKELDILNKNMENVRENKDDLTDLLEIINEFEKSWSGSWIGYHANLYYNDFQTPPPNERFDSLNGLAGMNSSNWESKSQRDIIQFINGKYHGLTLKEISEQLPLEQLFALKTKICSDLAFIRSFKNFDNEIAILDKIDDEDDVNWRSPDHIINEMKPKNVITRDQTALSEGVRIPPHIDCKSKILSLLDLISYFNTFIRTSNRLIRQIESRTSFEKSLNGDQSTKGNNSLIYIIIGLLLSSIIVTNVIKQYYFSSPDYDFIFFCLTIGIVLLIAILIGVKFMIYIYNYFKSK